MYLPYERNLDQTEVALLAAGIKPLPEPVAVEADRSGAADSEAAG